MAERKENGQFAPGHKGGPGRPKRRTEEQYLDATIGRVTLKDWREIVDKAVFQAKRGDSKARAWLSDYVLGPPIQRLQHQGEGGGPFVIRMTWGDDTDASEHL